MPTEQNQISEALAPTPAKRFGARAVLAAVALVVVTVPFGLLLLFVRAKWGPMLRFDNATRDSLHRYALAHHEFVTAMKTVSTLGTFPVYAAVFAIVILWLLRQRLRRLALFVAVAVVGSSLLNSVVKATVGRARPVLPDPVARARGQSFPSGHAQSAAVGYAVILLVFLPVLHGIWRRVAYAVSIAMVLAIGFSRVALGVHFVSDVLAGYLLGIAWVMALTAAFNLWRQDLGRRAVAPTEGLEPEHSQQLLPKLDEASPPRADVLEAQ